VVQPDKASRKKDPKVEEHGCEGNDEDRASGKCGGPPSGENNHGARVKDG